MPAFTIPNEFVQAMYKCNPKRAAAHGPGNAADAITAAGDRRKPPLTVPINPQL